MRHRGQDTRIEGGVLPAVLVLVFVVLAAVNAAIAVVDAVLWPVVVAGCGVIGAIVVARLCRVWRRPGRGFGTARRIVTQGLGQLPSAWPDLRVNDGQGRPVR